MVKVNSSLSQHARVVISLEASVLDWLQDTPRSWVMHSLFPACWFFFSCFCFHLLTSKIKGFETFFQEHYQSIQICRSWSGSKSFAYIVSRRQKSLLARNQCMANQQNGVHVHGRFRSAWAWNQTDLSFPCALNGGYGLIQCIDIDGKVQ